MKVARHSSSLIRSTFLDYFKKNDHTFIRSSPVIPFYDASLAFVNAGMNQFKNILLGHQLAPSSRVVNSQKCIRIGGKHNDLAAVGSDSYHHTFFEMLGNWSFGDYFKKEACSMAWNFLTLPPISIPPNHLFVTYFSGDEKLGLPEDLETKEIWLSLGVDKDRILPFGIKDNFWEMGKTGPCGSCTEIHYDYSGRSASERSRFVNEGFSDVIELWNIVFIKYNRDVSNTLESLPIHHVDTGLGFERFVAVMQGKTSNYDTDLFMPLFNVISEVTDAPSYTGKFGTNDKNGLDTAYRILADHTRMCVVAIADNMFPDQNHKLRRVLRKALMIAENNFKVKKDYKLIQEVANRVSDILSPVYPEISTNMKKIHFIVEQESELIKELKKVTAKQWKSIVDNDNRLLNVFTGIEAVGLPSAYNEIITTVSENDKVLKDDLALKLYDTYGISVDLIDDFANALGLEFCEEGFLNKMSELKKERMRNKNSVTKNPRVDKFIDKMLHKNIKFTNDEYKYVYETSLLNGIENYSFPKANSNIQSILLLDDKISDDHCHLFLNESDIILKDGYEVAIVLDKTNFYTEAGGQSGDIGQIKIIDNVNNTVVCLIVIKEVLKYFGYVLHFGKISKVSEKSSGNTELKICQNNVTAVLNVDREKRLSNMRNHTATHLINCVLHKLLTATCQKSSFINSDHLIFDFAVYKERFSNSTAIELENKVNELIRSRLPVSRRIINANEFLALDNVTLIPDVIYPDNEISLIEINDENENVISKEPCCGTHVFNTGDIEEFCLINVKSKSNVKSIKAVTGVNAKIASKNSKLILEKLRQFDEKVKLLMNETNIEESIIDGCSVELQDFKNELLTSKDKYFSYSVLCNTIESLNNYSKELIKLTRSNRKELLKLEMKTVIDNLECKKYLVHNIISCSDLDSTYSTLQKAEKMCPTDIPIMLFNYSNDNILKARCIIPAHFAEHLPADKWMNAVCRVIGASQSVYSGHDPRFTCGMRPKKIPKHKASDVINIAIAEAKVIMEDSLSSLKQ